MSYQFQARSIAALLTLALHAVLMSPLILGGQVRKAHSTAGGDLAGTQQSKAGVIATLVLLNDVHAAPTEPEVAHELTTTEPSVVANLEAVNAAPQLQVEGAEDGIDAATPSVTVAGDPTQRALMLVRYLGQVTSRIQRAWLLPRKMQMARFRCRVQIRQDANGAVQEVILQRCDDDVAAQMSLVKAVQSASPLPAPLADTPLNEPVTLDFEAIAASADVRMTSVIPSVSDL